MTKRSLCQVKGEERIMNSFGMLFCEKLLCLKGDK